MALLNSSQLDEMLKKIIEVYREDEDYGPSFSLKEANSETLHALAMHMLSQGMKEIIGSSEIDFEKEMDNIRGAAGIEADENKASLTLLLSKTVELLEGAVDKARKESGDPLRYSKTLALYCKKLNLMQPQSSTKGGLFSSTESGPSQWPQGTSSETSTPS